MSQDEPLGFREILTDAIRYWEMRRLIYNAALVLVVLVGVWSYWPYSKPGLTLPSLLMLFLLAVLANVCYCAVYAVDLLLQFSSFRPLWRRIRVLLLIVGILFAGVIAWFLSLNLLVPDFIHF